MMDLKMASTRLLCGAIALLASATATAYQLTFTDLNQKFMANNDVDTKQVCPDCALDQLTAVPVVPEPETYAMMIIGIGLIGLQLRRKSKQSRARRFEEGLGAAVNAGAERARGDRA